jgi:hypothetical protein
VGLPGIPQPHLLLTLSFSTVETLKDEIQYIWVSRGRGLEKDRSGNNLALRYDTATETLFWEDRLSFRKLPFGSGALSQGV